MTDAELRQIRTGIKEKYAEGAGCRFKYPTGKEGMQLQGYPSNIIGKLPDEVLADFCRVANPFILAPLSRAGSPGHRLQLRGGYVHRGRLVGHSGRVGGIDVTFATLQQARAHQK